MATRVASDVDNEATGTQPETKEETTSVVTENETVIMASTQPDPVTDEAAIMETLESLTNAPKDKPRVVNILMVGKVGSGKTSLANALLTNDSSGGSFGPERGSSKLISRETKKFADDRIVMNVLDAMGFADLLLPDDDIKNAVLQKCSIDEVTAVIVCFKWDERFDETCRKILARIGELHADIWEKVTFALTHFDHMPPEIRRMPKPERDARLRELLTTWEEYFKRELQRLHVSDKIVQDMQVVPTSHTAIDIEEKYYGALFADNVSNWLENIWSRIVDMAAKYQPHEIINILSMLEVHLLHQAKFTAGKIIPSVKDVQKFLTPAKIKGIFLGELVGGVVGGGVVGAGAGAVSLVLIAKVVAGLTLIGAASVAGAAGAAAVVASGGALVGAALGGAGIACLVAVVLYAAHKYKQKRNNSANC